MKDDKNTFAALVAKYAEHDSPRAIAEAIWQEHGAEVFTLLPAEWLVSILSERVRCFVSRQRSRAVHVVHDRAQGGTGACRVALAGDYWGKRWLVDGTYRETRALTLADLDWLIADRSRISDEARAQVAFFAANVALARKHKAKVLGDLERKGIGLVEVDAITDVAA